MPEHPFRARLNAWLLSVLDGYMHAKYARIKRGLLQGHPPTVLELGAGAGANLRYLPAGTRVTAVEPNRHMHEQLRRKAERYGLHIDVRELAGEALDIPSESIDFAYASLVLCTVAEPSQVVAEVLRVLRPGGRFVCVEHVASRDHLGIRRAQNLLRRSWRYVFEGCDLCRDTGSLLRKAGFSSVQVEEFRLPTFLVPVQPHISAVCVK